MQRRTLICSNFSGIDRRASIYDSSIITATDMQNVELFSVETNAGVGIRTMRGNVSVCDEIPNGEKVINLFESVQKSVTHMFVHTESESEGKIYLFSPNTGQLTLKVNNLAVTGKSSATDVSQGWSDLWVFSNGEDVLSIELGHLNDQNELEEVKILSLTDMDGRRVKGLGLVIYAGRLWIFNGQVLWYSVQENIYDFSTSDAEISTSAGYIEFVKKITAIYPYLGSLAVFHDDSSVIITPDESGFGFRKTSEFPGGCSGYNALVFHGTQLYFYDDTKKGVFSFLQVVNGDKTLGENIAINIQKELSDIKSGYAQNIKALSVVTAERNEVWVLIPDDDENYTTLMIYDYLRKSWVKRKSQKINSIAIVGNVLYSGGEKIYEECVSDTFDGEFIEAYYNCASLNLGMETALKIFAYPPKVILNMNYSNDFFIEYTKNYNSLTTKVRHVVSKTLNDVLYFDKGFWDKDKFPINDINAILKLPSSFFRTLQMSFYTKEVSQGFCINSIEFGKIKVKL